MGVVGGENGEKGKVVYLSSDVASRELHWRDSKLDKSLVVVLRQVKYL